MLGQTMLNYRSLKHQERRAERLGRKLNQARGMNAFFGLHGDLKEFEGPKRIQPAETLVPMAKHVDSKHKGDYEAAIGAAKKNEKQLDGMLTALGTVTGFTLMAGLLGVWIAVGVEAQEKTFELASKWFLSIFGSELAVLGTLAYIDKLKSNTIKYVEKSWERIQGIIKAAEPKEQPESRVPEPVG